MTWWDDKTLGILGLGNMGNAIASGVAQSGLLGDGCLVGFDPRPEELGCHKDLRRLESAGAVAERADVLLVAVKPYAVKGVVADALSGASVDCVVSVAAGVSLADLLNASRGRTSGVVRAMPNIAASVQAACTAIVGADSTDAVFVDAAARLFECIGTVVRFRDESLMHGFTGAVGSGIAYGFVFAEALADGAVAEGLSRETARRAAASVLRGAAELLLDDEAISPGAWKDAVCSPAGTTIEGVASLEASGFRAAVIGAVRAASARSRSLGSDE